jgi:flavin-dependent dehydrogenase
MAKVVVIGAGIAGISAAAGARKAGAEVVLLEKQDQLLGIGRIAGSMDVGGRYPLHLEAVEMGAGEVNATLDSVSYDNMDNYRKSHYPHHSLPGSEEMTKHSWVYNVMLAEPALRRLMEEMGVEIRWRTRAVDVEKKVTASPGSKSKSNAIVMNGLKPMPLLMPQALPAGWTPAPSMSAAARCAPGCSAPLLATG